MIRKTDPIKAYFIKCSIIFAVYIILLNLMVAFLNIFIAVIISILLFIPVKLLVRIIARNNFESILYRDLDPERFKKVVFSIKHFSPPITYRINAAIYSGDYQTTVNFFTKLLKDKCSSRNKYLYLSILARVYFELGDLDKLKTVCNTFDECTQSQANGNTIQKQYSMMQYYRYYLDGDFENCLTLCKKREAEINPKTFSFKVTYIYNDFNFAIAYYKIGETKTAKEYFEKIISTAPLMYIAQLSYKYLDLIENGDERILQNPEVFPDADHQLYSSSDHSRVRRRRIIIAVSLVIVFIGLAIPKINDAIQDIKHQKVVDRWEQKLNTALSSEYEAYKIIEYFDIVKDGSVIDAFCVVETNASIDLLSIVSYDDGITTSVIKNQTNVQTEKAYCIKSVTSDYYIGFRTYTEKNDIPQNTYHTTQVSANKWLFVDYIEGVPR